MRTCLSLYVAVGSILFVQLNHTRVRAISRSGEEAVKRGANLASKKLWVKGGAKS
jgi:hypothetical protein